MLRIRVTTANAEILETELITAGRVGLQCSFEFNEAWNGLTKTVVVSGCVRRHLALVNNKVLVPGECLAKENFPLQIGVYGVDGNGLTVIPTIWANFGKIRPSAGPVVDPEITPNLAAQIQYNSSEALRIAQELEEKADNGEFNGRDGATGPQGAAGTDGVDGNSLWYTTAAIGETSGEYRTPKRYMLGRDGTPNIGDMVVGREAGEAGDPSYLYRITGLSGPLAIMEGIGSIRGPQGETGATGPQGPKGDPGEVTQDEFDVLAGDVDDLKSALESGQYGLSESTKQALLQIARKVAYIDDQGQNYYQDLYDALYPPKTVVLITAVFEQGSTVIYDDTALNDLKQYLTVTAKYDDNTTAILADSAYTLSGLLEAPSSTVTVLYNGVSTTFSVAVTARPTLSSISAVYTQSGTVYDTDTLDSLKADLVVTANYSDSSTQTVPTADYTLSGTLTAGTSTITVSYGGKTTTFSVTVTSYYNIWTWDYADADELSMLRIKRAATTYIEGSAYRPAVGIGNSSSRRSFPVTKGKSGTQIIFEDGTPITIDGKDIYPIPVPPTATGVTCNVTPSTHNVAISVWKYDGAETWTRIINGAWSSGSGTQSLAADEGQYITINCKPASGNFSDATEPSIVVTFSA